MKPKITWTKTPGIKDKVILCLKCGMSYTEMATEFKTTVKAIEKYVYNNGLGKFRKAVPKKSQVSDLIDLSGMSDEQFIAQKEAAKIKWTIPVSNRKRDRQKPYQVGIALFDQHVPHQNTAANKAVLYLMDDIKFDKIILGGDFMDMGAISHWNQNKKKTLEKQRLREDYFIGNALLDQYDLRLPQDCDKRYFWGNHEDWYNQLIEEVPVLDGLFNPTEELKMKERGYLVYPYNHIEKIGRLHITHGIYAGSNPVKKHMDKCKVNIMFGHVHSPEMRFDASPAREIAMAGYAVGCLCDMNPAYMKNQPHNWVHGFAIIYFFEDGSFDVDLKRIVNGRFVYNGKVYDGNK